MAHDRGVAMEPADVAGLLKELRTLTLATIGPDGLPHLAAMWFACDGDDLLLWTYGTSQKVRNLERDPRAAVLGEAGEGYRELRGVCLDCRVEIVRDPDQVLRVGRAVHARNAAFAPGGNGLPGEESVRAQAAKRVGLRLRVERARTWDHRRLRHTATG